MGHIVSTLLRSYIAAELAAVHARPAVAGPKSPRAVPTEAVHRFVSFAVDTFLHDLLAESLVFRTEEHSVAYGYSTPSKAAGRCGEKLKWTTLNTIIALLSVSHQWRHMTLQTLATVLHTGYDKDGIGRFGARTLRDAVSILHTYTYIGPDSGLLEDASDKPGESPVMRVYHALIVLAREAARADAFPDACLRLVAGRSMTAAMLPCGIDPWVQCATRNLERCPGVFQLLLRHRVGDAVARASIADVYTEKRFGLDLLWRDVQGWYDDTVERGDPDTVPPSIDLGFGNDFKDIVQLLYLYLSTVFRENLRLLDAAAKWPPTRPVDEMIGRANYLGYIKTVGEIAAWPAQGEMQEACKSLARELHKTFKTRLETLAPC